MQSNPNIIQVQNLKVSYTQGKERTVDILQGINFNLERGKTLGIAGESGSGKSITVMSIMGLLSQNGLTQSGVIEYNPVGKSALNLLKCSEKEMSTLRGKEIAMIFQEPMTSLNPTMTCGNQVMEVLLRHEKISKAEAKKRVIALFDEVRLPRVEAMFSSYPHQLSGGQKQRIMIAMAIACNPKILIADEPTTALDVSVQKQIVDLLKKIQADYGMSMIFITHDLSLLTEIADDIAIMYKGNIVEQGKTIDIIGNPQNPYTKGLLACRPPVGIKPPTLPTLKDFVWEDEQGKLHEKAPSKYTEIEYDAPLKPQYESPPLVSVKNLSVIFSSSDGFFKKKESVKAVDDINLDIFKGETVGLVGESGCGKTTLGRTILKLNEPTSGKILYKNEDISRKSSEEMRKLRKDIQIIFQDPYSSLNPRMKIGEAIAEPMKVHKIHPDEQIKEKTFELLEKVGLKAEHYNRYPHEFSGGQRQRICIARALSVQPKFLVCDESVSALDVSIQAQIINLLNQLKIEFGLTYLFISHDLSVIYYMSDRILVMNKGKIVEQGTAEEIFNNPQHPYTQQLLASLPKM